MDQDVGDLSTHLRRERTQISPISLLSQLKARDEIWGSRGRRFKSCRPDQIIAVQRGVSEIGRSPFGIFGSHEPAGVQITAEVACRGLICVVLRILFMAVAALVSAGRISWR